MQESKFQVMNWKKWKATSLLLKNTKEELQNNIKAISYDNSLPGGPHKTIFEKYNKLIDMLEKYDQHIEMYDTMVNNLENSITSLLNEDQRKVIIIYANYPNKGQSDEREKEALEKGYSRANFYRIANESFEILDSVLKLNSDVIKRLDQSETKKP